MKDGLELIHKIWSDLKEKECCRRVVNVKRGKWRNGNKIRISSSQMKWGVGRKRQREIREKEGRERENKMS
jgi:hypothetical protein